LLRNRRFFWRRFFALPRASADAGIERISNGIRFRLPSLAAGSGELAILNSAIFLPSPAAAEVGIIEELPLHFGTDPKNTTLANGGPNKPRGNLLEKPIAIADG
jgi:hypothetical protein